jgi:hypothetical protein
MRAGLLTEPPQEEELETFPLFEEKAEINLTDNHHIIVASLEGDVSPVLVISSLLELVRTKPRLHPILLLGPASPFHFERFAPIKVGWVTFLAEGMGQGNGGLDVEVVSPENVLELNLFIERAGKDSRGKMIIIGDFLDNLLFSFAVNESFHKFYSQFCARIVAADRTAILIVKRELHDPRRVAIVERFADMVIRYSSGQSGGQAVTVFKVIDTK